MMNLKLTLSVKALRDSSYKYSLRIVNKLSTLIMGALAAKLRMKLCALTLNGGFNTLTLMNTNLIFSRRSMLASITVHRT